MVESKSLKLFLEKTHDNLWVVLSTLALAIVTERLQELSVLNVVCSFAMLAFAWVAMPLDSAQREIFNSSDEQIAQWYKQHKGKPRLSRLIKNARLIWVLGPLALILYIVSMLQG